MEVAELLVLLHRGGRSLRTVQLTATSRTDHEAVSRAMERWSRDRGGASTVYARGRAVETPRFIEETTRLWIEKPDKVREETTGHFPRHGVSVGDTWWMFNEHQGAITNNGSPNHSAGLGQQFEVMLEPAPLLAQFDFEPLGEQVHASRPVLRVRARPRPTPGHDRGFIPPLPVGCEHCEFLIDPEHGTLLRLTALYDGKPGVDLQIVDITFDEPIAPETFVFEPPPGETIQDITQGHGPRSEPIEAVASKASFTVFIATGLEEAWRMHAIYLASHRGQPHEQVHLGYHRDDATHSFAINEQPADTPALFTAVTEPEEIDYAGMTLRVIKPTDTFPLASVRLTRAGTSIEITSDNLGLDKLLDLAANLRPMPV